MLSYAFCKFTLKINISDSFKTLPTPDSKAFCGKHVYTARANKTQKEFFDCLPRPTPPFICYAPSSILADWSKLPCWVCQFTMVKSYFQRTVLPCQKTYSQHLYEELFYIIILDSHHSFFDGLEYHLLCASCTRFFCKKNVYEKMSLKTPSR